MPYNWKQRGANRSDIKGAGLIMNNITSSIEWGESLNLVQDEIDATHRRRFQFVHTLADADSGTSADI